MRLFTRSVWFAAALAVGTFAGCGAGGGATPSLLGAGASALRPSADGQKQLLAISEYGNQIVVLNGSYKPVLTIQDGLDSPGCLSYDNRGNLYAANSSNVTEYNPAGKLIYTYSSGISQPGCVAADAADNVYVGDFNHNAAGPLVEYAQGSSKPMHSCSTGLANGGIAIDSAGDVFVNGNNPTIYAANILEYKGGLQGCHAKTLLDTIAFGMGMRLDNQDDLVLADQECCVEILPKPYDRITKIINDVDLPTGLALNKANSLIFIVNGASSVIFADTFPHGKRVTTLGPQYGISDPEGVATFP